MITSKMIVPGIKNTQGINIPLVTFDVLLDTDFGLMLFIHRNFLDPKVFNMEFFQSHRAIRDMVKALIDREEKNPLSICLNEEYKSQADSLYKQFMDQYYTNILELSMYTEIKELILSVYNNGVADPIIMCKTEEEQKFVKDKCRILKSIPCYTFKDLGLRYDGEQRQVITKYKDDSYLEKLAPYIEGNTIYLANYKFNQFTEEDKDDLIIALLLAKYNRFSLMDIYSRAKIGGNKNE